MPLPTACSQSEVGGGAGKCTGAPKPVTRRGAEHRKASMEKSHVSDSRPGRGRLHLENTEFRFLGLLGIPGA